MNKGMWIVVVILVISIAATLYIPLIIWMSIKEKESNGGVRLCDWKRKGK